MKNSREIIDAEIALWVDRDKSLQVFFQIKVIKGFVGLCEIVTQGLVKRDVLIKRFIAGLALTRDYLVTKDDELPELITKLTKPIHDMIMIAVTSDEYRKHIIDLEITGTDILNCDGGVIARATSDELLLQIKRSGALPFIPRDIAKMLPDFRDYKMRQYVREVTVVPDNGKMSADLKMVAESKEAEMFDLPKEIALIITSENKFWKGLPMGAVIEHFKILTERKSRNGEAFLTEEQFVSFLKKGFLLAEEQPVQKINCSATEKGLVILRFYELYVLACSKFGYPAKTKKFIKLFTDCFDNWDSTTIKPFFRRNKTKEMW